MKSPVVDLVLEHMRGLARGAERTGDALAGQAAEVAALVAGVFENGGRVLFCGNGGSAADAQHLATEYVVRFRRERRPLPALALTTDTSLLTAAANDLGFEAVFARQVEAFGRPGDLLFLHSTSGVSPNLLAAARAARRAGVTTVALLARGGGPLRELVDHALVVPLDDAAHAQELQLALGHAICDAVERRLTEALIDLLEEARLAEKAQALYYRALASAAEDAGDPVLAERFNELHADEQHHLSRITARLLETGVAPAELPVDPPLAPPLDAWEEDARQREEEEVARYAALVARPHDAATRAVLEDILAGERLQLATLGGKWMWAEADRPVGDAAGHERGGGEDPGPAGAG
jgi:D-sedoheptulose 7-phosphate isomerase